jgi:hypothetical protein
MIDPRANRITSHQPSIIGLQHAANQAYYYLMLVSFFVFESFKEDTRNDILPIPSYATTVR